MPDLEFKNMVNFGIWILGGTLVFLAATVHANIGEGCMYDDDCFIEHSFCQNQRICRCKQGYQPDANSQSCIATIGALCHVDQDCKTLLNSRCNIEVCDCLEDYVPATNNAQCIPVVKQFNGSCVQDNQCIFQFGEWAECRDLKCQCSHGYHYAAGRCVISRGLGDSCQNKTVCYTERHQDRLDCRSGVCSCIDGFSRRGNICESSASVSRPSFFFWLGLIATISYKYLN